MDLVWFQRVRWKRSKKIQKEVWDTQNVLRRQPYDPNGIDKRRRMILGDSSFNFSQIRNRTLLMVCVITLFSILILTFASIIYAEYENDVHKAATLICIIADSINILIAVIELNALFFFREGQLKPLLFSTSAAYLFVLGSTVAEFSNKGGVTARVEEIMVIVSGCVVVLLGAFKNYYAYEYFMKGKEVLNEDIRDIRDSLLSQESYEQGLKNSLN